jgi:hypothetical protein
MLEIVHRLIASHQAYETIDFYCIFLEGTLERRRLLGRESDNNI